MASATGARPARLALSGSRLARVRRGVLPTSRPSIADMSEDINAFLDVLEIENAVIAGLSMGGYVLMQLYRTAPDRFAAMILANTKASADTPDARAAREQMAGLVRREGPPAVTDRILPKLLGVTSQRARPYLDRSSVG